MNHELSLVSGQAHKHPRKHDVYVSRPSPAEQGIGVSTMGLATITHKDEAKTSKAAEQLLTTEIQDDNGTMLEIMTGSELVPPPAIYLEEMSNSSSRQSPHAPGTFKTVQVVSSSLTKYPSPLINGDKATVLPYQCYTHHLFSYSSNTTCVASAPSHHHFHQNDMLTSGYLRDRMREESAIKGGSHFQEEAQVPQYPIWRDYFSSPADPTTIDSNLKYDNNSNTLWEAHTDPPQATAIFQNAPLLTKTGDVNGHQIAGMFGHQSSTRDATSRCHVGHGSRTLQLPVSPQRLVPVRRVPEDGRVAHEELTEENHKAEVEGYENSEDEPVKPYRKVGRNSRRCRFFSFVGFQTKKV